MLSLNVASIAASHQASLPYLVIMLLLPQPTLVCLSVSSLTVVMDLFVLSQKNGWVSDLGRGNSYRDAMNPGKRLSLDPLRKPRLL